VTYRLEYAETARRDLRDIGEYIHTAVGEAVAARFMRRLIARVNSLRVMPMRHRIRNELQAELRAVSVEKYIIFYQVIGDTVFIVRVLHSARNITSELFSS
jgi:toxin ParE1/3/4